jgi:hypothetical protein
MKTVPFYSNTKDDTHCYQAALRMVLGRFKPEVTYSFEELDVLTDKIDGKWTWPQAGLVSLIEKGFEVVIIDAFDYERFVNEGVQHLEDEYGKEVAKEQESHSDIPNAIKNIQKMLKHNIRIEDTPSLELLRKYIDDGYLLICNVNSSLLNGKEGYVGHFVVVYKMDENNITFHDPGLPAKKARTEMLDKFYDAWKISKDAYAIKLKEK